MYKKDGDLEATLSAGYQITVPSRVRKLLKLEPGDKLVFDIGGEKLTAKKALTRKEQIEEFFAEMERLDKKYDPYRTPKQKKMKEVTKGWTVNQFHRYFDGLPETKAYIKEKYGV